MIVEVKGAAIAMETEGLTAGLARLVATSPRAACPPEALHAVKRAFIDTLGVMLAGRHEAAVTCLDGCLVDGTEASALPGTRMLSAQDAALLGGTAGHVLDYDDVALHGHASVVLVPAILAETQRLSALGPDALTAYLVGFEVWSELARREPDAYHLGSWHPTPMLGTVAATASVAALNRLDERRTRHALAISASLASGVIANFGTHTKPLQAGRAAASAVEAVRFAQAGMEGASDALESPHGFLIGISPQGRVDTRSPVCLPGERWRLLEDGVSVKRYPVCYAAHRAVDAVIDLAAEAALPVEAVSRATVWLGIAPARTLRHARPQSGLEAKFSLHHNVAVALSEGRLGFGQLTDDYVRRPEVAAFYSLTHMELRDDPCPEQPGMARHDRVVIETKDGRRLDSGDIPYPKGHAKRPLSDTEIDAKFLDCARHGGVEDAADMLERLHNIDRSGTIGELFGHGL
jgi:aconitate decarboxylase